MILSASPDFPGLYLIDDTGEPRWAICNFAYLSPGLPTFLVAAQITSTISYTGGPVNGLQFSDGGVQPLSVDSNSGAVNGVQYETDANGNILNVVTLQFDASGNIIPGPGYIPGNLNPNGDSLTFTPIMEGPPYTIIFGGMNTNLNQGNSYLQGLVPNDLTPIVLPYPLQTYLYYHQGAYAGNYSTNHAFLLPKNYALQAVQGSDYTVKTGWAAEYRDFFTVIAVFAGMMVGSYYLMGMTASTAAGSVAGAEADAAAQAEAAALQAGEEQAAQLAAEQAAASAASTAAADAAAQAEAAALQAGEEQAAQIAATQAADAAAQAEAVALQTGEEQAAQITAEQVATTATTAGEGISLGDVASALTSPGAKAVEGIIAKAILQPTPKPAAQSGDLTTSQQTSKSSITLLAAGAALLFFLMR
jgi:hypothetical protein